MAATSDLDRSHAVAAPVSLCGVAALLSCAALVPPLQLEPRDGPAQHCLVLVPAVAAASMNARATPARTRRAVRRMAKEEERGDGLQRSTERGVSTHTEAAAAQRGAQWGNERQDNRKHRARSVEREACTAARGSAQSDRLIFPSRSLPSTIHTGRTFAGMIDLIGIKQRSQ